MNRRVLYTLALFLLGLMVGLIVSRFFVPDRYGLVTMIGIFLAGLLVGALLLIVGVNWGILRGRRLILSGTTPEPAAQLSPPWSWQAQFGARRITLRLDSVWWERFENKWLGVETAEDGKETQHFWDAHWAQVQLPHAHIVLVCLGLAIVAQLLILGNQLLLGLVVYAATGSALIAWLVRERLSLFDLLNAARIGRRAEILLLVLILLIAFSARVIQVGSQPTGIDGDELKWTAQTYYDFVANEQTGDFFGQQKWTPISFFLDKIAFDLFGIDFSSPRILTALMSVLATLIFYCVARDMFNVSVALLSTLFMATSYYDVNTSRQAIVETFTKLPMILALFLVIRGIDRQRWHYFLLCGIVLYLGIMTYDTFFVVPPVILLYMLYRAALNWRKWYRWLFYFALVIAPMLLAAPIVTDTVNGRQSTYVKGVSAGVSQLLTESTLRPTLDNMWQVFTVLFQALQLPDYALNWGGPLVNPLILILFVIGFALVLARFWQRHNLLLILSFVICFFPAPILSGYTVPRVFYIGLPPIFIFAGVSAAAVSTVVLSVTQTRALNTRIGAAGLATVLFLIVASDVYIYTNGLENQVDWLKRRSFVNTVKGSVQTAPLTLLPVTRTQDDFVWGNTGPLKFIAYTALKDENADKRVRVVDYAELPGVLNTLEGQYDHVSILYDRETGGNHPIAAQTIETIQRCYDNVRSRTGSFFITYTLQQKDLNNPKCYSLSDLVGQTPSSDQVVPANQPIMFQWEASSDRPTAHRIQVEKRNPKLVWIEGESFPLANGWMFEAKSDHYPGFSGTGYILDDVRSGETQVMADVPQDGKYKVWVRSLRSTREGHRSFVSVGDQKFEFARADEVELMQWNWEMVGQVDLQKGASPVTLSREYGNEGWKPVLIDAVFLSADPKFNPENNALWMQVVDTGQVNSTDTEYVLESGLEPGTYRWRVQLLDGDQLVDARGRKGVWSDKIEFHVQ